MEALERMGMELGSDVPYCVRAARCWCRGRRAAAVARAPECWFVVCKPQVSFSTAEMYRDWMERGWRSTRTPAG
ncbi:MAG: hypothetical protein ACLUIX_08575 [Oscillospiraceae bacterium]